MAKKFPKNSIKGQALLVAVMCLTLMASIVWAMTLKASMKKNALVALRTSIAHETLAQILQHSVDCEKTFLDAGINPKAPGGRCSSSDQMNGQVQPYIRLRRKNENGFSAYLTDKPSLEGFTKLNGHWIRVSCSQTQQSLVIRAFEPSSLLQNEFKLESSKLIFGQREVSSKTLCGELF